MSMISNPFGGAGSSPAVVDLLPSFCSSKSTRDLMGGYETRTGCGWHDIFLPTFTNANYSPQLADAHLSYIIRPSEVSN
jgi:hypothetical protein